MSVTIVPADARRLGELRDLYLSLHHAELAISPLPLTEPDERAWAARLVTYRAHFAAGRARLLVAEEEGRPVGYAFGLVDEGHDDTFPLGARVGELYTLVVAPDQRGRGVGTALLGALEGTLAAEGATGLRVEVMTGNEDALRFYRRHGLVEGEVVLYRVAPPGD
ncbi:MAG TPA: GNAT family N-acetyltransferase [Acidimicrobiales bacterium]|nr:MAG: hypothetical protein B7Z69_08850 [Actinobacteria bacterium 21-73-9]HQU27478.1 GNAT family N-acetyltransferase [Acidimicrobiales bacterium]